MSYFDLTEQGNANLIAKLNKDAGGILVYDHPFKRWIAWSKGEKRWFVDNANYVRRLVVDAAIHREKEAAKELERLKGAVLAEQALNDPRIEPYDSEEVEFLKRRIAWAKKSKNLRNIEDTLKLASSNQEIAFTKLWDENPDLFQVANGVLELNKPNVPFRSAKREDFLLKRSGIEYSKDAKCPRWIQFLREIFQDDAELIAYVQKGVGYTLTGSVKEQCLFACVGGGANGKSTFLNILTDLMGEYWCELKATALEKGDRVLGEGTGLLGARFAKCVEVSDEKPLNVARIKSWTGQDEMVVRPLYREAIHFTPTHKLWLSFNNYPTVDEATDAIWRRIKIVPFNAQFIGKTDDKELLSKLKAELPGILNWAIEGLRAYIASGLEVPARVYEATQSYRQDGDTFSLFMDEYLEFSPKSFVTSAELQTKYKEFCAIIGEEPAHPQSYRNILRHKGAVNKTHKVGGKPTKIWAGVALRTVTGNTHSNHPHDVDSKAFTVN